MVYTTFKWHLLFFSNPKSISDGNCMDRIREHRDHPGAFLQTDVANLQLMRHKSLVRGKAESKSFVVKTFIPRSIHGPGFGLIGTLAERMLPVKEGNFRVGTCTSISTTNNVAIYVHVVMNGPADKLSWEFVTVEDASKVDVLVDCRLADVQSNSWCDQSNAWLTNPMSCLRVIPCQINQVGLVKSFKMTPEPSL